MWLVVITLFYVCEIVSSMSGGSTFIQKCCPYNAELLPSLNECKPYNNISHSSETTEQLVDKEFKRRNETTEEEKTERMSEHLDYYAWLPYSLQGLFHDGALQVQIGRPRNCNRTLRLQVEQSGYRTVMHSNGTLEILFPTALNDSTSVFFEHEEFCVDTFNAESGKSQIAILLCPCDRVKCVNKCCPLNHVMWCDNAGCDCKNTNTTWRPVNPKLNPPERDFSYAVLDDQVPECREGFQPFIDVSTIFPNYFLRTFWEYPNGKIFNDVDICADTLIRSGASRQEMIRCGRVRPQWAKLSISYWLHVPEALLLAMAIITILIVPRMRASAYSYAHDYSMACHALSLLLRGVVWTMYTKSRMSAALCTCPPIIVYFSSIASSFWLNVICINMTCGFWRPLGLQNGRLRDARRMFLIYSIYAWGASSALTVLTATMWFSDDVPDGLIRPTLHETRTCYREEDGHGKMATFAYFFGPVIALLFINSFLFLSTASRVVLLRKNTQILGKKVSRGKDSAPHNQRSVMVYIKLVWLMGIMEVAVEVAAWASNSNEYYFTTAASCIDLLRAVAIFVLCCCKKRTLRALWERLRGCAALRPLFRVCGAEVVPRLKAPRGTSISLTTVTEASVVVEEQVPRQQGNLTPVHTTTEN